MHLVLSFYAATANVSKSPRLEAIRIDLWRGLLCTGWQPTLQAPHARGARRCFSIPPTASILESKGHRHRNCKLRFKDGLIAHVDQEYSRMSTTYNSGRERIRSAKGYDDRAKPKKVGNAVRLHTSSAIVVGRLGYMKCSFWW
jgi:hypothetical protein